MSRTAATLLIVVLTLSQTHAREGSEALRHLKRWILGEVIYFCPEGFQKRVPCLMAEADVDCCDHDWSSGQVGWSTENLVSAFV
jgi:hypothetical protein